MYCFKSINLTYSITVSMIVTNHYKVNEIRDKYKYFSLFFYFLTFLFSLFSTLTNIIIIFISCNIHGCLHI